MFFADNNLNMLGTCLTTLVVLHCITGLQAVVTLKNYFYDYNKGFDVITTSIIIHLLTETDLDIVNSEEEAESLSWGEIFERASKSLDVNTIKLTYTCEKLDRLFNVPQLKEAALHKIKGV